MNNLSYGYADELLCDDYAVEHMDEADIYYLKGVRDVVKANGLTGSFMSYTVGDRVNQIVQRLNESMEY